MPLTSAEYLKRCREKYSEEDREIHIQYYAYHKHKSHARVV